MKKSIVYFSVIVSGIFTIACNSQTDKRLNLHNGGDKSPGQQVSPQKANYNVFIENSESMDGYINQSSQFETSIFDLLNSLNNNQLADTVNLNYINAHPIPVYAAAGDNEIKNYIYHLSRQDFVNKGGSRKSSEFYELFDQVLNTVDENNAAILISDCIYYPANKDHKNPCVDTNQLEIQQIGLTRVFNKKLNQMRLGLIVLQMTSNFNGKYFDHCDKPMPNVSLQRPYYIWLIGSNSQIRSILRTGMLDHIANCTHRLVFSKMESPVHPRFNIARNAVQGFYNATSNGVIEDARPASNGSFCFSLMLDYSGSLQSDDYFLDNTIYDCSNPKYSCHVARVTDPADRNNGYTHRLYLQINSLQSERPLTINARAVLPAWVNVASSTDDSNILQDATEQSKTFGIRYLLHGAFAAFYPPGNGNIIYSTQITIKR